MTDWHSASRFSALSLDWQMEVVRLTEIEQQFISPLACNEGSFPLIGRA